MAEETQAVAQAPQIVETAPAAHDTIELIQQISAASIAQDNSEVSRLEALLTQSLGSKPPEAEKLAEQQEVKTDEQIAQEVIDQAAVDAAAEAAKVEAEAKVEDDELDATQQEPGEKPTPAKEPDRFRFKDPEDRAIAALAKSQGIPLAEAARLRSEIVAKGKPAEVVPEAAKPNQTILDLEAKAEEIKAKIREAGKDEKLVDADYAELTIELSDVMSDLKSERRAAKTIAEVRTIAEAERTQLSEAQLRQEWDRAAKDVAKAYPEMKDKGSTMFLATNGLALLMNDPTHPDHAELKKPTAPAFLAAKVAAMLKKTPVVAPAKVETAPTVPAKMVAKVAPGSKSSANPEPQLTDQQQVEAAVEAAQRAMVGRGYGRQTSSLMIL